MNSFYYVYVLVSETNEKLHYSGVTRDLNARLSEHGKANAVDIKSFTAANGKTAEVLADWGPTGHDIATQVAAAYAGAAHALVHVPQ